MFDVRSYGLHSRWSFSSRFDGRPCSSALFSSSRQEIMAWTRLAAALFDRYLLWRTMVRMRTFVNLHVIYTSFSRLSYEPCLTPMFLMLEDSTTFEGVDVKKNGPKNTTLWDAKLKVQRSEVAAFCGNLFLSLGEIWIQPFKGWSIYMYDDI